MDLDRIRNLIVERVKSSAAHRENWRRLRLLQEAAPWPEPDEDRTVAERAMRDAFAILSALTAPETRERLHPEAAAGPENVKPEDLGRI
jgi:hypothetical protein